MNKVLLGGSDALERSNSINSQSSSIGKQDAEALAETDASPSIGSGQQSADDTPTSKVTTSMSSNSVLMEQPTRTGPRPDFQNEVLGELGEFAESGDTSIYTGPEQEVTPEKLPTISRIKEEEMNLLSPTKSRSKLPTSSRKGEKGSSPTTVASNNVSNDCDVDQREDESVEKVSPLTALIPCGDSATCEEDSTAADIVKGEFIPPVYRKVELPVTCIKTEADDAPMSSVLMPDNKVEGVDKKPDVTHDTLIKKKTLAIKSEILSTTCSKSNSNSKSTSKHHSSSSSSSTHGNSKSGSKGDKYDGTSKGSSNSSRKPSKEGSSSSSAGRRHDCSRCYKRSKIKRYNIGCQTRNDTSSSDATSSTTSNKLTPFCINTATTATTTGSRPRAALTRPHVLLASGDVTCYLLLKTRDRGLG